MAACSPWSEASISAAAAWSPRPTDPWLVLTRQAYAGMLRGRGRREDLDRAEVFDAATHAAAGRIGMDLPGWGRAPLGPVEVSVPRTR